MAKSEQPHTKEQEDQSLNGERNSLVGHRKHFASLFWQVWSGIVREKNSVDQNSDNTWEF